MQYAYVVLFRQAYHALLVTAKLRRGESVLIHEGETALGQAAIRVALELGCGALYTTVRGEQEKEMLLRHMPKVTSRYTPCTRDFQYG